jgi:hypothetical protein
MNGWRNPTVFPFAEDILIFKCSLPYLIVVQSYQRSVRGRRSVQENFHGDELKSFELHAMPSVLMQFIIQVHNDVVLQNE